MSKQRIDALLVSRGLSQSREQAKLMVLEGAVSVNGAAVLKANTLVNEDVEIKLIERPRFASRGGFKLEHALDQFRLDVANLVAADIGASNGGFTDCLLKRGAGRVYAIDVGYGQLDYRLRQDPRVVVMDRVNARYPFSLPELIDLATIDVSFISVKKVIPTVAGLLKENGRFVVLVKPQFEAGREQVGKGGVIRDPLVHASVLGEFISWAVERGYRLKGLVASPVLGSSGNREFLVSLNMCDKKDLWHQMRTGTVNQ